ncbi:hypothetical protein Nepgr_002019 [Nepenthes gracilis]|uniref:E3 ubiquitin protein ligase n=1 Tax=Nepenthes gracilis TaxID=150966 RepID=A0AAD3P3B9_NEPGR|nr:hypothetical protein Nepgr_002019 [Nepenthes gracilis]
MENTDSGELEKKRPHLNSVSSTMARNSITSPDNKSDDAAVLQYQNQALVQQLDRQKHELHDLEVKIQELKERQSSYDDRLIAVNQLWNQLVDDLVLLGIRAGGGQIFLQTLENEDHLRGSIPSCPAEDAFLCRLLKTNSIEGNGIDETDKFVKEALAQRHSSTLELMKFLEDIIEGQRAKANGIAQALRGNLSTEDAILQLPTFDSLMEEEVNNLCNVVTILQQKHKEYADGIQNYIQHHLVDQAEIKQLTGELEESITELEESRRKLVNLKMQKLSASQVHPPILGAANGNLSLEKPFDRMLGLRELKDSIEEAKIVAADRLAELEEAREDNLILLNQLEDLQNEVKDDKHVYSSRMYALLSDQLHHWKAEAERYKALIGSLQADRSVLIRREKELELKAEATETAKTSVASAESRVEELELQLQNCITEKNDLEIKLEEAIQDAGRKDIKDEFQVMGSALSKEMEMMEAQLNRWKEMAHEALSLREEAQSLKAVLNKKIGEVKGLEGKCAQQMAKIKSLKELIEKLQKENLELQIFVDMHGQESYDSSFRDVREIQESEKRAIAQAEVLKHALDEHSLELRVKAANEAEAACQQRLSAVEAEISDLRVKLDATERSVHELTEAIRIKDAEAEAYISEIETIGQAYEDMQTQNRHLLQQMTERDDYNIKLVSESVKTKQAQSVLLSEKQTLAKQLQVVNAALVSLGTRISRSEEQMKVTMSEAVKSTEEDRHLAVSLETAKWELADAEKELRWQKSAIASSEKEHEQIQRKIDEVQLELDGERNDRKKLEEELKEWNDKVAEMTAETGEAAMQKLQEEIKDCKSILKCGVCFDRPKEVVIVKCYHLFCNQCIQRNLEMRHRKCPGCGNAFGQNDVRFVKI